MLYIIPLHLIYFIHSSLYLLIPSIDVAPAPTPTLRWPAVCSLYLWVCFCLALWRGRGRGRGGAQWAVCGILVLWPGIPSPTAVEVWSLNHWTDREVPVCFVIFCFSLRKQSVQHQVCRAGRTAAASNSCLSAVTRDIVLEFTSWMATALPNIRWTSQEGAGAGAERWASGWASPFKEHAGSTTWWLPLTSNLTSNRAGKGHPGLNLGFDRHEGDSTYLEDSVPPTECVKPVGIFHFSDLENLLWFEGDMIRKLKKKLLDSN